MTLLSLLGIAALMGVAFAAEPREFLAAVFWIPPAGAVGAGRPVVDRRKERRRTESRRLALTISSRGLSSLVDMMKSLEVDGSW